MKRVIFQSYCGFVAGSGLLGMYRGSDFEYPIERMEYDILGLGKLTIENPSTMQTSYYMAASFAANAALCPLAPLFVLGNLILSKI